MSAMKIANDILCLACLLFTPLIFYAACVQPQAKMEAAKRPPTDCPVCPVCPPVVVCPPVPVCNATCDLRIFTACLTGPRRPIMRADGLDGWGWHPIDEQNRMADLQKMFELCGPYDRNGDGDVDLHDWALTERAANGR